MQVTVSRFFEKVELSMPAPTKADRPLPASLDTRGGEAVIERLRALAPSCDYNARKLARMLEISERQLQRIFSSVLAQSPQDWLNRQRLSAARQMLPNASSVKEVAYALGFRRASQFSRDFRLAFGQSPSQLLPSRPISTQLRWPRSPSS
jgi:AraC-like DNA-binding protein